MPATYEPIATTTLGSAAASITFSSIAGTYTDLRLIVTAFKDGAGSAYPILQFNNDTATNYSATRLTGDGSSAASARSTNIDSIYIDAEYGATSSIPSLGIVDIFSYAGSTYKTALVNLSIDKNGSGAVLRRVGLWRSTSAITSLKVSEGAAGNFASGTTATLYGIKNA